MAFPDDFEELNGRFGRLAGGIDTVGVGDFFLDHGGRPYSSDAFGIGGGRQPTIYGDLSRSIITVSVLGAQVTAFRWALARISCA